MREIKFRAWDKITKQLYPIWDIGFKGWDGQEDSIINYISICVDGVVKRAENEAILMQFTGLKDKNGVEIYEGDIVKVNIPDPINKVFYENFIIIWQEDKMRFGLQELNKQNHPDSWAFTPKNDFEIIGNIYENHKLLK